MPETEEIELLQKAGFGLGLFHFFHSLVKTAGKSLCMLTTPGVG